MSVQIITGPRTIVNGKTTLSEQIIVEALTDFDEPQEHADQTKEIVAHLFDALEEKQFAEREEEESFIGYAEPIHLAEPTIDHERALDLLDGCLLELTKLKYDLVDHGIDPESIVEQGVVNAAIDQFHALTQDVSDTLKRQFEAEENITENNIINAGIIEGYQELNKNLEAENEELKRLNKMVNEVNVELNDKIAEKDAEIHELRANLFRINLKLVEEQQRTRNRAARDLPGVPWAVVTWENGRQLDVDTKDRSKTTGALKNRTEVEKMWEKSVPNHFGSL